MTRSNAIRAALAVAPIALFAFAPAAQAQTNLSRFNFNEVAAGDTLDATTRAGLFAADGGLFASTSNITLSPGYAVADGTVGSSNTGINSFGGTTVNAFTGDTAGNDLAFQASNATTGTPNNGQYVQFNLAKGTYTNLVFSLAGRATGTGFNTNTFQYSTNGTTFTNFGTFPTLTTTYQAVTFDLSSITALNTASTAYFRIVLGGATTSAGNLRIDNVQLNGTAATGGAVAPEPATLALMTVGLVGGVVARRRRNK